MYPFAEQILAYRAEDPVRRIGGLILDVKADFCGKVREILTRTAIRPRNVVFGRTYPRMPNQDHLIADGYKD